MPRRVGATRRLGFFLLGLAALLSLGACETSDRQRRLGDFVEELIYGGPFDADAPRVSGLQRWADDLRVSLEGPESEIHRDAILATTRSMAALAGLEARPARDGESANLSIRLSDETNFTVRNDFVDCYMRFEIELDKIVSAQIVIGMNDPEAPNHCLVHELMHAFGFRNHSAIVRSALSPIHGETELTTWDRLALRVLYDQRLKPGASRSAARPVIDELIAEFLSQS